MNKKFAVVSFIDAFGDTQVTSLEKDDVLKGGNSEKIIINIKNNNKEKGHFNFNINYIFKES